MAGPSATALRAEASWIVPPLTHQRLLGPVTGCCGPKLNGWAYRSVRPVEYIQLDANVVSSQSAASTPKPKDAGRQLAHGSDDSLI